jgi:hypothetical protein
MDGKRNVGDSQSQPRFVSTLPIKLGYQGICQIYEQQGQQA